MFVVIYCTRQCFESYLGNFSCLISIFFRPFAKFTKISRNRCRYCKFSVNFRAFAFHVVQRILPPEHPIFSRLTKIHAKALTCFNFFNFHSVSTKFRIDIEHVILTNRMFFVFRIAAFLAGK
jgi:hypothetical protein